MESPYLKRRREQLQRADPPALLATRCSAIGRTDGEQGRLRGLGQRSAASFVKTSPTGWTTPAVDRAEKGAVLQPDGSVLLTRSPQDKATENAAQATPGRSA